VGQISVATYRGNYQRTGEYEDAGVPDLHGIAWRFQTGGPIDLTPVVADGLVLFGSADGFFYALDSQTGQLHWRYQTRGRVITPADVADELVYLCDDASTLYALELHTGKTAWIWDPTCLPSLDEWLGMIPAEGAGTVFCDEVGAAGGDLSFPMVSDGKLFVTGAAYFYALNLATRRLVWWQYGDGYKPLCPVLDHSIIYCSRCITNNDRVLMALRAETGANIWAPLRDDLDDLEKFSYGSCPNSVAARDGVLYRTSFSGIHGIHPTTGNQVWQGHRERVHQYTTMGLTVGSKHVYETIADANEETAMILTAYDRQSGQRIWRLLSAWNPGSKWWTYDYLPPTLASDVLYVIQHGEVLCALDAATGQQRCRASLEEGIVAPPCIADETAFVAAGPSVYALR
jgi:outer membrane protein assembly factor BamB